MCKVLRSIVFSGALLLISVVPQASAQSGEKQLPSPDVVVQALANKLQLSDDQKTSIEPIIVNRQQQLRQLQADTSSRRLQKARKLKSIFESSDKKIDALLTPEQKKEYAKLREQMRQQVKERIRDGSQ